MIWRVHTRHDFEQLRRGRRRRSGPLTVTQGPGDPARPAKVAYAISRKVGTAPRRNLLRRRLRAILTAEASRLTHASYLITASAGAAELPFDELRTYLMEALSALSALDHDENYD